MEFEIIKTRKTNSGTIILASLPGNAVTPWATWWTPEFRGKDSERHYGHYHPEWAEALNDYETRF
jgi:hypothetical protein